MPGAEQDISLGLNALANIATPDLARDLVFDAGPTFPVEIRRHTFYDRNPSELFKAAF